jgi:hypothetical protein
MAGMVRIDTNGDVTIEGNLYVAGSIESSSLTLRQKAISSEQEAENGFGRLLSVQDAQGNEVAVIDASGSAKFASMTTEKLIIAGSEATASAELANGEIRTNATAGKAVIPAGLSEITIKNKNVTDYTLIYVTPTSSTLNNVLYVKSKEPGRFIVGFNNPIGIDVNFNWWIIDVTQ